MVSLALLLVPAHFFAASRAEFLVPPEQVLNEYIPFVGDWCDVTNKELAPGGKCPSWQDPKTAGAHSHRSKAWAVSSV